MFAPSVALRSLAVLSLLALGAGCSAETGSEDVDSSSDELRGPGAFASDKRVPELGNDLTVLAQSNVTLAQGITEAEKTGAVIEAKFELDDAKKLSLSLYPVSQAPSVDAERQV